MEGIFVMRLSAFAIVFAVLCFDTSFAADNKPKVDCRAGEGRDKDAKLSCFTCMGRDLENCDWGTVCCKGACFTLIDDDHEIIAKGCTNEKVADGAVEKRNTTVKLHWADNEVLNGQMYFCNKEDYCNGGSSLIASVIVLVVTLVFLKAAV